MGIIREAARSQSLAISLEKLGTDEISVEMIDDIADVLSDIGSGLSAKQGLAGAYIPLLRRRFAKTLQLANIIPKNISDVNNGKITLGKSANKLLTTNSNESISDNLKRGVALVKAYSSYFDLIWVLFEDYDGRIEDIDDAELGKILDRIEPDFIKITKEFFNKDYTVRRKSKHATTEYIHSNVVLFSKGKLDKSDQDSRINSISEFKIRRSTAGRVVDRSKTVVDQLTLDEISEFTDVFREVMEEATRHGSELTRFMRKGYDNYHGISSERMRAIGLLFVNVSINYNVIIKEIAELGEGFSLYLKEYNIVLEEQI